MPSKTGGTLKGHIVTQAIAVVGFVIVPAVVTLVAPITTLEFRRDRAAATVTVKRYALMVIPWQTRQVRNVTALEAETTPEFRYRDTAENRRKGRAGAVSYATGQLVVVSDGPDVIVQAAPALAEDVSARFRQFLDSKSDGPVSTTVYASWGLSYVLGGIVSALAALYLAGACFAVLALPFKRRTAGVSA